MTDRPPPRQIGRPLEELTDADWRELLASVQWGQRLAPAEVAVQIAPLKPETARKALKYQRQGILRAFKLATKYRDNDAAQGILQLAAQYIRAGRKMPRELAPPIAAGLERWKRCNAAAKELRELGAITNRRGAARAAGLLEKIAELLGRSNADPRNAKLLAQATRAAKLFFGQGAGRRPAVNHWTLAVSVHFGGPGPNPDFLGVLSGRPVDAAIRDAADHHGVHPDTAEAAYQRFRFRLYGIARPTTLPKLRAYGRKPARQRDAVAPVIGGPKPVSWFGSTLRAEFRSPRSRGKYRR